MPEKISHKFGAVYCDRCAQILSQCHPKLRTLYSEMRNIDSEVHVSWGYRNEAEQMEAFRNGKSNAKYGQSAHNTKILGKPFSQAIDIFFLSAQTKGDFTAERFNILFDKLPKDTMTAYTWGGTFKKLSDLGHYELKGWKSSEDSSQS